MDQVAAVVLGGGRGARLYPLTALRAKPAVPLLGRYRLVDIPLSQCIHSGIKRIVVLTQFNSASLHRHIQNSYKFDNFSKGFVEILAAEQTMESGDWYQGTADAVRKQLRHIRDLRAVHYLVLSGDQLYSMDYRTFVQTHLEHDADITIAALPVSHEEATRLGIMRINDRGRVTGFVEKPAGDARLARLATPARTFARAGIACGDRPYLASMGLYLFRAEVLGAILEGEPDWTDFGKHIMPYSLRNRRVFAHPFDGFWEDIGTVRSYYEVHMRMASAHPPLELFSPELLIYTHPRYLPGSRFHDVQIRDSIICEGCRIRQARIRNSIIGIRSIVRAGARIERSVLMGADFLENESAARSVIPLGIGAGSTIVGAIIDKNARIGRGVVIRGSRKLRDRDGEGYAVRDGIVVVLKNALIPDGARIE
jgi:glucose-1-phosphate adenylyltransferase